MRLYQFCSNRWKSICSVLAILTLSGLLTATIMSSNIFGTSQADQAKRVSVNDPRPLAKAIESLEKELRVVITYEDPEYQNENDIVDITAPAFRLSNPDKRVLIPKGGNLEYNYVLPVMTDKQANPLALIQGLIDVHHSSNNPGIFRLVQTGDTFHVVPSKVQDLSGNITEQRSLLDYSISVPAQERTGYQTLESITTAISQASNVRVAIGTIPIGLFLRAKVTVDATDESARTILNRTLANVNKSLSWQLLYDPGMKMYALNIYPAYVNSDKRNLSTQTVAPNKQSQQDQVSPTRRRQ